MKTLDFFSIVPIINVKIVECAKKMIAEYTGRLQEKIEITTEVKIA